MSKREWFEGPVAFPTHGNCGLRAEGRINKAMKKESSLSKEDVEKEPDEESEPLFKKGKKKESPQQERDETIYSDDIDKSKKEKMRIPQDESDEALSKTEQTTKKGLGEALDIFKAVPGPGMPGGKIITPSMPKPKFPSKGARGPGSRGGKVIGYTDSGKAIYANSHLPSKHRGWSAEDHANASTAHHQEAGRALRDMAEWKRSEAQERLYRGSGPRTSKEAKHMMHSYLSDFHHAKHRAAKYPDEKDLQENTASTAHAHAEKNRMLHPVLKKWEEEYPKY